MIKFILIALIALAVGGSAAQAVQTHPTVTTATAPRVCFPAEDWGPVSDSKRPCVRITHLYEDGTYDVKVTDADGTVRPPTYP